MWNSGGASLQITNQDFDMIYRHKAVLQKIDGTKSRNA